MGACFCKRSMKKSAVAEYRSREGKSESKSEGKGEGKGENKEDSYYLGKFEDFYDRL